MLLCIACMAMFDASAHILLTGGTGFFGLALLRHWRAMGKDAPRLTVLSRDPQKFAASHPELAAMAQWVVGDVLEPASLPRTGIFSHVLHGAADSTHGPRLTPLQRYAQIVDGTRNVLDLALATQASRFLLVSSGAVYGAQAPEMTQIPETHHGIPDPLDEKSAYGIAKRNAEHLGILYQQQHGLEFTIARCFAFIGQDLPRDVHFAAGNFIRDALTCDQIMVESDGTSIRSYMDQRDLAHWLLVLLSHGQAGQAYNVGSDMPISIRDLAFMIRDVLSPSKPVVFRQRPAQAGLPNRYVPSIQKCKDRLGLALRFTLEDSLRAFKAST